MSLRASFQFYPLDWIGNPNLKRCTRAERSMWLDIMCLMSQEERFGVLRWPLADIALAISEPVKAIEGLVRKGVMKGSDTRCEAFIHIPWVCRKAGPAATIITEQGGPIWFSPQMVTDDFLSFNNDIDPIVDMDTAISRVRWKIEVSALSVNSKSARLRMEVFTRDNFTCQYCGAKHLDLDCDHVTPRSLGGETVLGNLITACFRCNRSKGDRTLEEWRPPNGGRP